MCAINPSFHMPSLNRYFFLLMVTLRTENLPGKKAWTKYCIENTKP